MSPPPQIQHAPAACPALAGPSGLPADCGSLPEAACRVIDELRLLYRIAEILQEEGELKAILLQVAQVLSEAEGYSWVVLRRSNRAKGELEIEIQAGPAAQTGHPALAQGEPQLAQKVMETASTWLLLSSRPAEPLATAALEDAGTARLLPQDSLLIAVPILYHRDCLGVLAVAKECPPLVAIKAALRLLPTAAQLLARAVHLRQQAAEQIDYLRQENERLQEQMQRQFRPDNIIGNSRAMRLVYQSIEQVAPGATTVLIRGETGTGKELVAHAIHQASPRRDRPFVKLNCAALPETIVESELFGHERGAFTGAIAMRKGRFELAHRGTLFLDEVGELPLATQAKLLRVLQEREFERVGGTQPLACDVRVIAATNRRLEDMVADGQFREDLYYRLNVFPIYLPPLRERKSDILLLADFFIEKYNRLNHKSIQRISTPAIDMLMAYSWPGNVRELENCIERATLLASDDVIHGHHLPPTLQMPLASRPDQAGPRLQEAVDAFEREMIYDALKAHVGNMAAAARQLGITERIMALRVKKYRLQPDEFRRPAA